MKLRQWALIRFGTTIAWIATAGAPSSEPGISAKASAEVLIEDSEGQVCKGEAGISHSSGRTQQEVTCIVVDSPDDIPTGPLFPDATAPRPSTSPPLSPPPTPPAPAPPPDQARAGGNGAGVRGGTAGGAGGGSTTADSVADSLPASPAGFEATTGGASPAPTDVAAAHCGGCGWVAALVAAACMAGVFGWA